MENLNNLPEAPREKIIYVMISRTSTGFARLIQKCGKLRYNHAAIVLDESFDRIYAVARPKHTGLLLAGIVRESLDRYVLKKNYDVPIAVFEFKVSEEEYDKVSEFIDKGLYSPEYLYNMYSVFTTPIFGGFSVSKSFSCVEFVSYILKNLGFLDKNPCKYRPDDFLEIFADRLVYEGDIRGKVSYIPECPTYYDGLSAKEVLLSIKKFIRITGRSDAQIFRKKETS